MSPKIIDYAKVLDKASEILISKKINFKFVKSNSIALSFVSSDCSMWASGKLITIYPNTVEEASELMEKLFKTFIDYEGSEVLTDRPYKTSKIVFLDMGIILLKICQIL